MIDLSAWCVMPASRHRELPVTSGVYVITDGTRSMYAGSSINLRQRFVSGHQALRQPWRAPRIFWKPLSANVIRTVEREIVRQLRPKLNHGRDVTAYSYAVELRRGSGMFLTRDVWYATVSAAAQFLNLSDSELRARLRRHELPVLMPLMNDVEAISVQHLCEWLLSRSESYDHV